jgi:hypothetical protein
MLRDDADFVFVAFEVRKLKFGAQFSVGWGSNVKC